MTRDPFLQRRTLLLSGLACAAYAGRALPALAADTSPTEALVFDVYRGDALLGHHRVNFTREGASLTADIQVDMAAKLGPITVFHYTHQARERWVNGRFASLQASSITNGRRQTVTAVRTDTGVTVTPAEGPAYQADARALPLTHWNRQTMFAPLFNPQDGKPMRLHASAQGRETVQLSDGRSVQADRYSLTGETQIDDWYDRQDAWTALRAKVKDGSIVLYKRVAA